MNINDASCILCDTPIRLLSGTPRFCGDCFEKITVAERAELTASQKLYFTLGEYIEKICMGGVRDEKKNSAKHSSPEDKRSSD